MLDKSVLVNQPAVAAVDARIEHHAVCEACMPWGGCPQQLNLCIDAEHSTAAVADVAYFEHIMLPYCHCVVLCRLSWVTLWTPLSTIWTMESTR